MYAKTTKEREEKIKELLSNETCVKYPLFINHVKKDLLPRYKEWALSERYEKQYPTHGVNTTNFVEASMRMTKDLQMKPAKAYNLGDLLDIMLERGTFYYQQRLIDIGNNRPTQMMVSNIKSKYKPKPSKI